MNYSRELELAKQAAVEAGKRVMEYYDSNNASVYSKEDKSPCTAADLAANEIIVKKIKEEFSEDGILTEEAKDDLTRLQRSRVWVIDPLDGTKEFISHNGEFTVNIALVENNEPVIGVIYVPALKELFYGSKEGSFVEKDGVVQKLQVSTRSNLNEMILVKSRSHSSAKEAQLETQFAETKVSGSSLKGCRIAQGRADVYYRFGPTHEWDICAMSCILAFAGGVMTTLEGKSLRFNQEQTLIQGFVTSNNTIHEKLVNLSEVQNG